MGWIILLGIAVTILGLKHGRDTYRDAMIGWAISVSGVAVTLVACWVAHVTAPFETTPMAVYENVTDIDCDISGRLGVMAFIDDTGKQRIVSYSELKKYTTEDEPYIEVYGSQSLFNTFLGEPHSVIIYTNE